MSLPPGYTTVIKDSPQQIPARGGKLSVKDTMAAFQRLDVARGHPGLVILKPSGGVAPGKPTQIKVFRAQGGVEAEDETYQKAWNASYNVFSALKPSEQTLWLHPGIHFIQDYFYTPYDDRTHCIIECSESFVRYSLQSYRGISTWYMSQYAIKFDSTGKPPDEPVPSFHPFYRNKLIPSSHKIFASLEALAGCTWKSHHQTCSAGHFRVNIHLTSDYLTGAKAKFITHSVCGDALVADLFRVIQRCSSPSEVYREPDDWQSFRHVLWHEDLQYGICGKQYVQLGNLYNYHMLKQKRVTFNDTQWFKDREYVWLLPYRTVCSNEIDLETGDPSP